MWVRFSDARTVAVAQVAEEEGVVAHLALIHVHVDLRDGLGLVHAHAHQAVSQGAVQHHGVVLLLQTAHAAVHHDVPLEGQAVAQNLAFQPTEHEGAQDLVQLGDDALLLLGGEDVLHLGVLADVAEGEPRLEHLQVVENHRGTKVQQTPQLFKRVLNGRSSQQQARDGLNVLQLSNQATVAVLNSMTFVQNDVLPGILFEKWSVNDAHLKTGYDDWKRQTLLLSNWQMLLSQRLPLFFVPMIQNYWTSGKPFLEFIDPIGDGCQWTGN